MFMSFFSTTYPSEFSPIWMKEGAYAEYKFESVHIWFLNGTRVDFEDHADAVFRWECIEINETYAILNVTIAFQENGLQIKLSGNVSVELSTRRVIGSDGTVYGRTRLWLPSYPEEGDIFVMFDYPLMTAEVTDVGSFYRGTSQGAQYVFNIEGWGNVQGWPALFDGSYDVDAGVAISFDTSHEPLLDAVGIYEAGLSGTMTFSDTNIDLGPRNIWPEILYALLYSTPVLVFITIFVMVHRRRKRKQIR